MTHSCTSEPIDTNMKEYVYPAGECVFQRKGPNGGRVYAVVKTVDGPTFAKIYQNYYPYQ